MAVTTTSAVCIVTSTGFVFMQVQAQYSTLTVTCNVNL
jgi:hypothetical protein